MSDNNPSILVWNPDQATELVDALLEQERSKPFPARFCIDTAYGPWETKRFTTGSRKTTRGVNFRPVRLVENSAGLMASMGMTIKRRRAILSDRSLEAARRDASPEVAADLVDLYVVVWRLDTLLNLDEDGVPQWRQALMERARARLLKHLSTIVSTGSKVGVHLVLVGDGVPQQLREPLAGETADV